MDFSVIGIALITAYIAYYFNYISKKREIFLKELTNSYNEVYFPMYVELSTIESTEDRTTKLKLVESFIDENSTKESKVKFIGTTSVLQYFDDLKLIYKTYKLENNADNEKRLLESMSYFFENIKMEYLDAHDIIYENHLRFKSSSFINPFFSSFISIMRIGYHLSVFLVAISIAIVYFTFANKISSYGMFPPTLMDIPTSLLILCITVMLFAIFLMTRGFIMQKNRRKSEVLKKIKTKLKSRLLLKLLNLIEKFRV